MQNNTKQNKIRQMQRQYKIVHDKNKPRQHKARKGQYDTMSNN